MVPVRAVTTVDQAWRRGAGLYVPRLARRGRAVRMRISESTRHVKQR